MKVFAVILSLALMLTACSGPATPSAGASTEAPKEEKTAVTKVTDYLFEMNCDGYTQSEELYQFFKRYNPKLGGCSSVQNGTIRGRNYDWIYDEEPEFIIRVAADGKGRHASIGVAATTDITAQEVEKNGVGKLEKILPYLTLDGINDAGLTININVVGYEEMGEYVMKDSDPKNDICPLMVPRLILDGAGSIDEALKIMEGLDIFSLGTEEEAHYMISGPQSAADPTFNTVVVELIPDANKHYQLSVIDYNKGQFVDNKPVMTNFHLTGFDGSAASATRHPMGLERWQTLHDNFEQGSTVRGMQDLMKKVYYTKAYDLFNEHFWYSELTGGELDMSYAGPDNLHGDISAAGVFADAIREAMQEYNSLQRNGKTWHTVHTSVYDIPARTLYVTPQEGGYSWVFTLGK